ncbi:MAG: DUF885 family protein, partial [Myxococcota bacterium]
MPSATQPPQPPSSEAALTTLGEDYWELVMRHSPTWATYLGDRRYDGMLTDPSEAAVLQRLKEVEALQQRLLAIDRSSLAPSAQVTADVLEYSLGSTKASRACKGWLWEVSQLGGPQSGMPELARFFSIQTPEHARALLARYRLVAGIFDAHTANLRRGLAAGYVAPRINVERVIRQLEDQSHLPPADSTYIKLATQQLDQSGLGPDVLVDDQGQPLREQFLKIVTEAIYPAMKRYEAFLKADILPKAREDVGVTALPGGEACYRAKIERSTGLDSSADAIHAI